MVPGEVGGAKSADGGSARTVCTFSFYLWFDDWMVNIQYYSGRDGQPSDFLRQDSHERVHRQMHRPRQYHDFHPRRAHLLQHVFIPRFRCTSDVPKFQSIAGRPRTDSEEFNLRLTTSENDHFPSDLYPFRLHSLAFSSSAPATSPMQPTSAPLCS